MTDLDVVDTCIVGAGVVGLAIARDMVADGQSVVVLEQESRYGEGVSSRNSEVIHAGIYYPQDSLKARLCVRGKQLLYEYCESRRIEHRKIGKLIVATTSDEALELEQIRQKAAENGVDDLAYVSAAKLRQIEPEVRATEALFSPSTGIVSAHGLMTALLGDFEAGGGSLACHARLVSVVRRQGLFVLTTMIEGQSFELGCRRLVNSAGLQAQAVAASIEGMPVNEIPQRYLCKGNYFLMQGRNPFNHLIYPVPEKNAAGLGVHATIDIGGQVKFGPDVEYLSAEDYSVSDDRLRRSYDAIRRYYPGLIEASLVPGYAGIRPKLQAEGESARDFMIQGEKDHGVPGLINLFGIESPGLTSSMAIAETVATQLNLGS